MFYIKRLIALCLVLCVFFGLSGCKKEDGTIQSGEFVVLEDTSDISLAIYNIDTLNPIATRSKSVQRIMNIIYEPLFALDEKKELEGVLASSYSITGANQLTVMLKSGVKWSDGTPFDANDVVYTISRIASGEGLYTNAKNAIESATVLSSNKVVITFYEQAANLAHYLTFPIIKNGSADGEEFVPVGTDAYCYQSKSGTEFLFMPNTLWHGKEISKKNIKIKILKDKYALSEAFAVGEIDALTSEDVSEDFTTSKGSSEMVSVMTDKMVFLGFNTAGSALSSSYLRRAISNLIDKQKILENNAYGHGKVADISINPASWAYVAREEKADAKTTAKKLIEGEGYVLENGIYHKDGQALTVKLLVNADNAGRATIADEIAANLTTAGFSVLVDKVSYEEYLTKINQKAFDIFVGETRAEPNLSPMALISGEDNYFGFDASNLKSIADELTWIVGKDDYRKKIGDFISVFYQDPPYLPLYFRSESVIYASYVLGRTAPVEGDSYKGIEKWYFYEKNVKQEENSDE